MMFVIPLISGFANFHRGGFLPTGHTQLSRLDFSIMMAGCIYLATFNPLLAGVALPLWFLGCFSPKGAWQRVIDPMQVLFGCACGVLTVAPMVAALWWFGYNPIPLLVAGATQGLIYLFSWRCLPLNFGLWNATSAAETMFGIVMGIAISFS